MTTTPTVRKTKAQREAAAGHGTAPDHKTVGTPCFKCAFVSLVACLVAFAAGRKGLEVSE